jgi:flagellar protein FliO/FliZ
MLIGLSLIIGVMFLLAALLRRLRLGGTNQAQAVIRIKESRAIGSKRLLCLVEVKGRELLLGVTPEKIETLCQFKADPAQSGFDQALKEQDRA